LQGFLNGHHADLLTIVTDDANLRKELST
jgi:hypothetical protein